jgi:hypothetical protein
MKVKKSNIDIVKGYLEGTRPFIQVGYVPSTIQRKEGEEWVDASGKKWRQTKGGQVTVNAQAELIRSLTSQKCSCGQDIRYGNPLDEKFFFKTGKCYECIIKDETRLRVLGVFPHYEKYKLLSNYLGFVKDMQQKIQDSIRYLENESGTLSVLCNGDGYIEKFQGMNTTDLLKSAKKDLAEVIKTVAIVKKDTAAAKQIFKKAEGKALKMLTAKPHS